MNASDFDVDKKHAEISTHPDVKVSKSLISADERYDQTAPPGQNAASVHSMLRNDTEVGLPIHLSKKQSIESQIPKEKPIRELSGTSPNGEMQNLDGHLASSISPQLRLNHHVRQQRSVNDGPKHASTPHKLYKGHILSGHPTQSVNYQNMGLPSHGRPRSPFAYPTRLKRPGYRPSSPAWSDLNQTAHRPSFDTRTSSPLSTHSLSRVHSSWSQSTDYSDPALSYYPPFLSQGNALLCQHSLISSRTTTPRPDPSLRSIGSSVNITSPQRSKFSLKDQKVSFREDPLFYDYSEGFEELDRRYETPIDLVKQNGTSTPASKSLTRISKHKMGRPPPSRKTYSSRDINDEQNHPLTENGLYLADCASNAMRTSVTERTVPSQASKTQTLPHLASQPMQSPGLAAPTDDANSIMVSDQIDLEPAIQDFPQSQKSFPAVGEQPSPVPPRDRNSNTSTESMQTAGSSAGNEVSINLNKPDHSVNLSDLHANESNKTEKSENIGSLWTVVKEKYINEDLSSVDSSKIISPTPERSILSDNNRHRFSRILGVDDSVSMKKGPSQSSSSLQANDEDLHRNFQPDSIRENTDHHKGVSIHASLLDDSDSDEVPKLSVSLMRTFGRHVKVTENEERSLENSYLAQETSNTSPEASDKLPEPTTPTSQSSIGLINNESEKSADQIGTILRPAGLNGNRYAHIIGPSTKDFSEPEENTAQTASRSQQAVIAIPPPTTKYRRSLPFAFSPLKPIVGEETLHSSGLESTSYFEGDAYATELAGDNLDLHMPKNSDEAEDRVSTVSSQASRPWNRDSNYPWNDEALKLDVALPEESRQTPSPIGRFPKFKLRIHRASASSAGTGRYTRSRSSSDGTASFSRSSSHILRQTPVFKSRARQKRAIGPSQENSSHVVGEETLRSRFVESFDSPSIVENEKITPAITLVPPSPSHEVRSFFSDDSSGIRQKGSLKKRLSDFRARHSQSNSAEDVRDHDRGLRNTAFQRSRANGRTSRQSQTTGGESGASGLMQTRVRILRHVRFWWRGKEKRLRSWNRTIRHKRAGSGKA